MKLLQIPLWNRNQTLCSLGEQIENEVGRFAKYGVLSQESMINCIRNAIRVLDLIQIELNLMEISPMAQLRFHQFTLTWKFAIWCRIQGINKNLDIDVMVIQWI